MKPKSYTSKLLMCFLRRYKNKVAAKQGTFIPYKIERDSRGKILTSKPKCTKRFYYRKKIYINAAYQYRPTISVNCSSNISHSLIKEIRSASIGRDLSSLCMNNPYINARTMSVDVRLPEIQKLKPPSGNSLSREVLNHEKRLYRHWAKIGF